MAKLSSMESFRRSFSPRKRQATCVWWRLRTGLERLLLCGWTLVSLFFFALCITVIILASAQHQKQNDLADSVCLTRECLNEASRIMDYLDQSVNPCDDFYRFSCGKWLNSVVIDDESNSVSTFTVTQNKVNQKLRALLEEDIHPLDSKTVQNMKNMYNSCMNLSVINELGSQPLKKYVNLLGGWPVVEGELWDENSFDFIDLITKIRSFGFKNQFLFTVKVSVDFKRNTKHSIYLSDPLFSSLSKRELIANNTDKMKAYLDFVVNVSVLLGADRDVAKNQLQEVIELEQLLAMETKLAGGYSSVTVKDLELMAPMNWSQLLNAFLSIDNKINESETLLVSKVRTVIAISRIVSNYLENDKRVLANYIIWKVVFQSIRALDTDFRQLYEDFYLKTSLLKIKTKNWKICLNWISTYMREGLTSLYLINDKEREGKKNLTNKMFETIRLSLNEKLSQTDWMDDSTRFSAVHKLNATNKFIAYTNELIDKNEIDQFYFMLDLERDSFFENLRKLQKWIENNQYSRLRTYNDRNGWRNIITGPEVNAYYSGPINGIKIPIWILNGIFFGTKRPSYLNYGSLGWIIGHELIHPFDKTGGSFDSKGNYRDWWDVDTREMFQNRSECFVKQYHDNFPDQIGEESKLSENMADNGGIDIAYKGYKNFVEMNGQELPLPGLTYTPDQLFWISAAQIWCSKLSPKAHKYHIQNSVHSFSEQRVQISLSNSKEFSKSFNCRERDRMNPKHKCKVW